MLVIWKLGCPHYVIVLIEASHNIVCTHHPADFGKSKVNPNFRTSHYLSNTANISDSNESQSNRFFEPDSRHTTFFRVQFESYNFQVIIPDSIFKIFILFWTKDNHWDRLFKFKRSIFISDNFPDFYLLLHPVVGKKENFLCW